MLRCPREKSRALTFIDNKPKETSVSESATTKAERLKLEVFVFISCQ